MAYGYIMDMNGVSEPQDYSIRAVAQFGDDDGTGGDDELAVGGTSWQSYVGGQLTWNPDGNPDGSWDSGWVPVQLTLKVGGGANGVTFSAPGSDPGDLVDSGESYGVITGVEVTAAAQAQGSFAWSDVNVTFGNAAGQTETYAAATGPAVDATNDDPNGVSREQGMYVGASASNDTTVTVTGNVRMTGPHGATFGANDLFGEILVYTAPRSA